MPKVYLINDGGHDFSDAKRFGEVVVCTSGEVDRWDVSQMYRRLATAMKDSEPEDYLLLTSLTSLCSVACSIFAVKHNRLQLLLFKDGRYVERTLLLDKLNTTKDTHAHESHTYPASRGRSHLQR